VLLSTPNGRHIKVRKYSPVTRTLGPVLGSQQPSCPWVPCVPPGLWGPQGVQNYLWGTLWAMQGQWVHGDLLAHTTKGWLCQCTPHHAQTPSPKRPQTGSPTRNDVFFTITHRHGSATRPWAHFCGPRSADGGLPRSPHKSACGSPQCGPTRTLPHTPHMPYRFFVE
jgi:hypothetical protein